MSLTATLKRNCRTSPRFCIRSLPPPPLAPHLMLSSLTASSCTSAFFLALQAAIKVMIKARRKTTIYKNMLVLSTPTPAPPPLPPPFFRLFCLLHSHIPSVVRIHLWFLEFRACRFSYLCTKFRHKGWTHATFEGQGSTLYTNTYIHIYKYLSMCAYTFQN